MRETSGFRGTQVEKHYAIVYNQETAFTGNNPSVYECHCFAVSHTVKPIYYNQCWDLKIVAVVDR